MHTNRPPDKRLIDLIKSLSSSDVQNRLMRIADREIAVSLLYVEDADRRYVLSFLGGAKRRRVEEEIEYTDRMRIRYPYYRTMIENVIDRLAGGNSGSIRSYLRPIR